MSSVRKIEANRRNARLSTGPVSHEGKKKSRQNALRHGLTAETVIETLEDAEDYAAFQMAVTADYDAQSAVERELVLRLANLLWRLRRASAIETGLFKIQARQLLLFRQRRKADGEHQELLEATGRSAIGLVEEGVSGCDGELASHLNAFSPSTMEVPTTTDDITRSFIHLNELPNCPLDRLSRYEAALWRQACQILFTLQFSNRRKPWERLKFR